MHFAGMLLQSENILLLLFFLKNNVWDLFNGPLELPNMHKHTKANTLSHTFSHKALQPGQRKACGESTF